MHNAERVTLPYSELVLFYGGAPSIHLRPQESKIAKAICDRVIQTGLPHPSESLPDAQRMTSLLSDLRLSPDQRRQIYTNTFREYDYDGAAAALRVLYLSVNCTDVPCAFAGFFIKNEKVEQLHK